MFPCCTDYFEGIGVRVGFERFCIRYGQTLLFGSGVAVQSVSVEVWGGLFQWYGVGKMAFYRCLLARTLTF
jgi:hypothetical protein